MNRWKRLLGGWITALLLLPASAAFAEITITFGDGTNGGSAWTVSKQGTLGNYSVSSNIPSSQAYWYGNDVNNVPTHSVLSVFIPGYNGPSTSTTYTITGSIKTTGPIDLDLGANQLMVAFHNLNTKFGTGGGVAMSVVIDSGATAGAWGTDSNGNRILLKLPNNNTPAGQGFNPITGQWSNITDDASRESGNGNLDVRITDTRWHTITVTFAWTNVQTISPSPAQVDFYFSN